LISVPSAGNRLASNVKGLVLKIPLKLSMMNMFEPKKNKKQHRLFRLFSGVLYVNRIMYTIIFKPEIINRPKNQDLKNHKLCPRIHLDPWPKLDCPM
jgi:hypothetical protein